MFKGDIVFRRDKISSEYTIAILERMFSFKNMEWKKELTARAKESTNYHICVRVGDLDKVMDKVIKNNEEKIVISNVATEVFETEGRKELVLYLIT